MVIDQCLLNFELLQIFPAARAISTIKYIFHMKIFTFNNYCSSRPGFKIPSGDRGRWSTSCLPTRAYVQRKRRKMKEFRLSLCFLFPVLARGYGGPLKTRFKIYCRRILYDWYWDEYSVCGNSYLWRITKCYKTWTILFFSLLQIKTTLHRTC